MKTLLIPFVMFATSFAASLAAQSTLITLDAVMDTYVEQNNPDTNYGTASTLVLGSNKGLNLQRALVRFDTSSFNNYGAIQRAWLVPYWNQPNATIQVETVGANWDELTVTWNNQPSPTGPQVTARMQSSGRGYNWPIDVTSMVAQANSGFCLRAADEASGATFLVGGSREASQPARLIVQFAFATYGASCGLPIAAIGAPQIGAAYTIFAGPVPISAAGSVVLLVGTQPLDVSLAPIGLNGCSLLTSSELVLPMTAVPVTNAVSWRLPFAIPNNPVFYGLSLYHQALHVDANGVVQLTSGMTATIFDPNA